MAITWTAAGGYLAAPQLSKQLRFQLQKMAKFRQMCDAKDASVMAKRKGDKFHWNVYTDVAVAGGALTETLAMPETTMSVEQSSLTVTEYGNSVPLTAKAQELSEHELRDIVNKALKNDARNTLDKMAYDQFAATPLVVAPTGGTSADSVDLSTNGTTAITNNKELGADHVKAIVDLMKERGIPGHTGDDYLCAARPATLRPIRNELESIHQYTDSGFGMILNGEIGRYEGVRFIYQTNIASKGWSNAKSDEAFFIGEDTVTEAIVVPEEIRGKIPGDFGRDNGVAWYYLGGAGLVRPQAANATVVKWSSAA